MSRLFEKHFTYYYFDLIMITVTTTLCFRFIWLLVILKKTFHKIWGHFSYFLMKHIFKLSSSFWYQIFIYCYWFVWIVCVLYWLLEIEFENVFSQFISWLFNCWFFELLFNSFYFRLSGWIFYLCCLYFGCYI